MSRPRKFAMLMLMSIAPMTFVMAQSTQAPPSEMQPAPSSSDPSAASTPHQKQATHDQMMKDCMKKEKQKDSSMSKEQLKKACQDQMKMQQPNG